MSGSGGRPTRDAAQRKGEQVLDAATTLFLRDGYGLTSLEAVAAAAGVSKRTLYARFNGKAALLREVVARLVALWRPPFDAGFEQGDALEPILLAAARAMLATALAPEALALHRLVVAEIGRFPELGRIMQDAGTGLGVERLAAALAQAGVADPAWAAGQFMALVLFAPQRQALGDGPALDAGQQAEWAARATSLFLRGIVACSAAAGATSGRVSRL